MNNLYVRTLSVLLDTVIALQLSTSPTFLADVTTVQVVLGVAATASITAMNDGTFRIEISNGINVSIETTRVFPPGCYALNYVSAVSIISGPLVVNLIPGNIAMNVLETYFINTAANPLAWSVEPCCIRKNTKVMCENEIVPIQKIKSGDSVLNRNGEKVKVIHNIKYEIPATRFSKIRKGSLKNNMPRNDLYLTVEHPILIKNTIVPAGEVENCEIVQETDEIFSLVTEFDEWLILENVPVKSFSKQHFENSIAKNDIVFSRI